MNYHEKYKNFYNSSEWRRLRARKFADAEGLCEKCYKEGKIVEGKEVHHIIPIDKDWSKRLNYDNLILLCPDCHNAAHKRTSPLQQFLEEFDKL